MVEKLHLQIHKKYQNFYYAKLADTVGRFEEALNLIQLHILQGYQYDKHNALKAIGGKVMFFDLEEIELFSQIAKNYITFEKKTLKKLNMVEQKLLRKNGEAYKINVTKEYYEKVEEKLVDWLYKILIQIDQILLPNIKEKEKSLIVNDNKHKHNDANDIEQSETRSQDNHTKMEQLKLEQLYAVEKIICLRLRGDLYRYLCDFTSGFDNKQAQDMALQSYQQASAESCKVSPAKPVVLKLALSHSMFYYEILSSVEMAMKIIGEAMVEAKDDSNNFKRKASDYEVKEFQETIKILDINLQKFKEDLVDIAKQSISQNL